MDEIPYQMISNLRPNAATDWRLQVRLTRMWRNINRNAETVPVNFIFVDALGGRIHAWIPPQHFQQLENNFIEGETYVVHRFVVRRYLPMQNERCFENDIYIQLNHMTEVFVIGGVDYIPPHVFQFTDFDAIVDAARQNQYLIDVVGILQAVGPLTPFRNKYNVQENSIQFTISDMFTSTKVVFYNEMAQSFDQAVRDAVRHPIIVIISSCKAKFMQDEPKLTDLTPTRFFINENNEAVEDLRNALRLAN
ncbi:uncharacterized protein LOC108221375 [Daucus carota subsp. sativus]|uniref:uncharacterized protein LOC108221375 n=1 Tax=Daucus carota subsp. sativus TaxID=79200 RepID=UPI0007B19551|nr:PREDICTED: uncharacterized protein LOC108221375 [Daucus carota subsp. sativus]